MALAESWHVRSRGRECAATGQPFADGETIVTALYPDPESSGYVRRDFSEAGWNQQKETGDPPFSFWRSSYAAPASKEDENPIEKLSPEEILRRLVDEDEDHTENTRYILAVMLERKKILRETDSQQVPEGILRVYEHRKNGEVYIVRDPNVALADIEKLQQEVFDLLENNGRLPKPAEEEDPAGEIPAPEEIAEGMAEEPPLTEEGAPGETENLS